MTQRFDTSVHFLKKDGTYASFLPGDAVPVWLRGKLGDHIATYDDAKHAATDTVDPELVAVRKLADELGVTYTDGDDVATVQAAVDAETQRREDEAKAGTANADVSDDELRAKLTAIGQPTDGDHDALVARLNEHEG
jgi:hypothetical protein